ncbi:MAG: hypothetical protein LC685_05665 [Actinobacteria bacterium]|nr:hypothetical protein [Actinomycetota bacterium]
MRRQDAGNTAPSAGGGSTPAANPTAATATAAAPADAAPAKAGGWGTFKGQVVFGSSPPEVPVLEEKGKAEKDPQYCAKDAPIKSERLIVDGATKGVKNVLVYFPKPSAVNEEARSAKAGTDIVFDQVKCVFEPHVLGMMVGSKITLKSSDDVNHNINASLQKNSPINPVLAAGQSAPFAPTDSERSPVPVTCNIHPWMQAWWMVLDNPYFAATDAKGNFEIKNVPAGKQKVVVWQEATGFVSPSAGEEVAIKADDTTSKSWTIDPAKVKPAR